MKFSSLGLMPKLLVCALLFIFSISKTFATDNFPYGCIIFYNGAERVFTDFQGIDPVGGARIYALNTSYKQGTGNCEVSVAFTTPYSGGCKVQGVNTGSNVTIQEVFNCNLDKGTAISMFLLALSGAAVIRKNKGWGDGK